nr:hypothetical protein [Actinopolymorpha rutila]
MPILWIFLARGHVLSEHHLARQEQQQAALQDYAQKTARIPSQADELTGLTKLRDRGDSSEAEYQQARSKVLS